jgi:hypothetical protein
MTSLLARAGLPNPGIESKKTLAGERLARHSASLQTCRHRERQNQLITETRAHFKKPGHLVAQGATLDDDRSLVPNMAQPSHNPSKRNQERQTRSSADLWELQRFEAAEICSSYGAVAMGFRCVAGA